jgi:hypothetical protein
MNLSEVMEFYSDEIYSPEPDWYVPLEKICAFSKHNEDFTMVYVTSLSAPIRVKGNIKDLVDIFDMKIKAILDD